MLEAAGSDFTKVLKFNVYLKTYEDFAPMNEVYITHFPGVKPVSDLLRSCGKEAWVDELAAGADLCCGPGSAV